MKIYNTDANLDLKRISIYDKLISNKQRTRNSNKISILRDLEVGEI